MAATLKIRLKKMKTQSIYNHIQGLNPKQSEVSSIGSIVSASSEMISEYIYKEIISYLPTTSLAYKILTSNLGIYTSKQLWVITFELEKNSDFVAKFTSEQNEFEVSEKSKKTFKSASNKIKAEKRKAFQNQVNSNLNNCMQIGIGEEVIHQMFGEGVVIFTSEEKITVNFHEVGEKSLSPKFAKLTKK